MLKNRLIPVLLLRNGVMVQSKGFKRYQCLGNPTMVVERLSDWVADELIYLDISRQPTYDLGRDDLGSENRSELMDILHDVAKKCFMPLAFGGGIRTLEDAMIRIRLGADKIVINSKPLESPEFVEICARELGSQCVVVSMDVRRESQDFRVFSSGGCKETSWNATDWAREVELRGAGEILVNSIDEDGRGQGYDTELIRRVVDSVAIPVIALGGVGQWAHFEEGLSSGADAVAAANIFNYSENSVFQAKKFLFEAGCNVRRPNLRDELRELEIAL